MLRLTQSIAIIDRHTCVSMVCPVRATERKIMGEYLSSHEIATHVRKIETLMASAAKKVDARFVQVPLMTITPRLVERLFFGQKTRRYLSLEGRLIGHNAVPWNEGACIVLIRTPVAGEGYDQSLLDEVVVATPSRHKDQYRASSVEAFVRFDILDDNRLEAKSALSALKRLEDALIKLTV